MSDEERDQVEQPNVTNEEIEETSRCNRYCTCAVLSWSSTRSKGVGCASMVEILAVSDLGPMGR